MKKELLYIKNRRNRKDRYPGLVIIANDLGYVWSEKERGNSNNLKDNEVKFGVVVMDITEEQLRGIPLHQFKVDNVNKPTGLINTPTEEWIRNEDEWILKDDYIKNKDVFNGIEILGQDKKYVKLDKKELDKRFPVIRTT